MVISFVNNWHSSQIWQPNHNNLSNYITILPKSASLIFMIIRLKITLYFVFATRWWATRYFREIRFHPNTNTCWSSRCYFRAFIRYNRASKLRLIYWEYIGFNLGKRDYFPKEWVYFDDDLFVGDWFIYLKCASDFSLRWFLCIKFILFFVFL